MKVSLIEYTGKDSSNLGGAYRDDRRAAALLIFAKSTRLTMSPNLLEEIESWSEEKILEELKYIAGTIPSSWEFIDYTFLIEDVTRAFTHQFVRSRHWSFAQQTMRVLDVSSGWGWDYLAGPSIGKDSRVDWRYRNTMSIIAESYKDLINDGAKIEDARGILPTNILTNIVGKCNMRTFVETIRKRTSPRTQSEYRDVLIGMTLAVREVHPWIDLFIDRDFDRAAKDLDKEILEIDDEVKRIRMIKLVDTMRGKS